MKHHLYDKPLADKYQIRNKLKSGGFGSVYLAKGVGKDTNEYAVKLIPKKFKKYAEIQFQIYEIIEKQEYTHGFVKQYDHGKIENDYFLAMQLLSYDLEELMIKNKGKFSVKTTLMVGLQIIDRIQALHKIGYLHRDIKPDNMAIGMKDKNTTLYLIDFGLSKNINQPLDQSQKGKMIGTLAYMSCRCHDGKPQSPLDDMESFIYSLMYMIKGDLPWMKINIQSPADYHKIKLMKQKISQNWFISNKIPLQLLQCLKYVRNCKDPKQLDYLKCKYKLLSGLQKIKADNDFIFDWCHPKTNKKDQHINSALQKKQIQKQKQRIRIEKAVQYKKQIQAKKNRPATADKMKINQDKMQKDNKKLIDNEVFEIYKFLEKQQGTLEQDKNSKKKIDKKDQRNKIQKQPIMNKNTNIAVQRPISAKKVYKQKKSDNYLQMNRQLQKKLKLIESMKVQGPKIAINHQKL